MLMHPSLNDIVNQNVLNLIAYKDGFLKGVVVSPFICDSLVTVSDDYKRRGGSHVEAFHEFLKHLKLAHASRKNVRD